MRWRMNWGGGRSFLRWGTMEIFKREEEGHRCGDVVAFVEIFGV